MRKNEKTKSQYISADFEADYSFDLDVSIWGEGYQNNKASILFEALEMLREERLKVVLFEHDATGKDVSSAASFKEDYDTAKEMQRQIFESVCKIGFHNYLKAQAHKGQYFQDLLIKNLNGTEDKEAYERQEAEYRSCFVNHATF
ncbi:hypothetical protein IC229_27635 [Spirosoma sp. BT702]|uniref:Uncharacterized protein n=1 Tax=Spirosoma profusum TaxID=2771354 RepID=A0A927APG5_9BACT|nr:hypothetical protein [Spirosoma profusum]MBD2704444.1 hypothetical protein [Spirosoma profusum]